MIAILVQRLTRSFDTDRHIDIILLSYRTYNWRLNFEPFYMYTLYHYPCNFLLISAFAKFPSPLLAQIFSYFIFLLSRVSSFRKILHISNLKKKSISNNFKMKDFLSKDYQKPCQKSRFFSGKLLNYFTLPSLEARI